MFYMRSEINRFLFRSAVCVLTVVLIGFSMRLWAGYSLSVKAQAQTVSLSSGNSERETVMVSASTGEEQSASLWGFLRWIVGFDPTDPVSVVAYSLPGVEAIDIIESATTLATPEEEGDQDADSDLVIETDPDLMPSIEISGQGPQVLIYHTHTQEAYAKQSDQAYAELPNTRTTNQDYNVVRVGDELARQLGLRYGISVLHDTTDHEPPELGTAYIRSCKTVESYLEQYSDLKILIDMHRDAYNSRSWEPSTVTIDSEEVSRIMIIIGTGEGSTGTGYAVKPDWQKNLQVAQQLVDELNKIHPQLALPVNIKTGRYNQHLSTGSILIEMGHNENTLDQAVRSADYLAQALAAIMGSGS